MLYFMGAMDTGREGKVIMFSFPSFHVEGYVILACKITTMTSPFTAVQINTGHRSSKLMFLHPFRESFLPIIFLMIYSNDKLYGVLV
jgi:hypothetical protein